MTISDPNSGRGNALRVDIDILAAVNFPAQKCELSFDILRRKVNVQGT